MTVSVCHLHRITLVQRNTAFLYSIVDMVLMTCNTIMININHFSTIFHCYIMTTYFRRMTVRDDGNTKFSLVTGPPVGANCHHCGGSHHTGIGCVSKSIDSIVKGIVFGPESLCPTIILIKYFPFGEFLILLVILINSYLQSK